MAIGGGGEASVKRTAYVRLATKADVPLIVRLIEGLAEFEKLSHQCQATESGLESTIFRQPPFWGPTVLILELESSAPAAAAAAQSTPPPQPPPAAEGDVFEEKRHEVNLSADLTDPIAATFASAKDGSRIVVGFVLCFPNYSTFLTKPGIYIEDLYVREAYRRQGLGSLLLKTVAEVAANRGLGRVEWSVLDWNANAIKFYEAMGAIVQQEWRICRLTADALQAYRSQK